MARQQRCMTRASARTQAISIANEQVFPRRGHQTPVRRWLLPWTNGGMLVRCKPQWIAIVDRLEARRGYHRTSICIGDGMNTMDWGHHQGSGFSVDVRSAAGMSTNVLLRYTKRLGMLFDIGDGAHERYWGVTDVFISHSHIDHLGGIFTHARIRSLQGANENNKTKYYVPIESVSTLEQARQAFESLDSPQNPKPLHMDVIGVQPGDKIEVKKDVMVTVFATKHRVPSVGYQVWRLHKRMKQEFIGLSKQEKQELFRPRPGVERIDPHEEVWSCDFCYTGDTTSEGLVSSQAFLGSNAKIVCIELTFLQDDDRDKAQEHEHIHLEDIITEPKILRVLDRARNVVFAHFSRRYSTFEIIRLLADKLPPNLLHKSIPALESFGAAELLWKYAPSAKDLACNLTKKSNRDGQDMLSDLRPSKILWESAFAFQAKLRSSQGVEIPILACFTRGNYDAPYLALLAGYLVDKREAKEMIGLLLVHAETPSENLETEYELVVERNNLPRDVDQSKIIHLFVLDRNSEHPRLESMCDGCEKDQAHACVRVSLVIP